MNAERLQQFYFWLQTNGYIRSDIHASSMSAPLSVAEIERRVVQSGIISVEQYREFGQRFLASTQRASGSAMSTPKPSPFGRYEIERELGRGGMGVVYLANDPELKRSVALKTFSLDNLNDPLSLSRFQREARSLAQLNHPNVVAIHDLQMEAGTQPFLVMQYYPAETLEDRLKKTQTLSDLVAVRLFQQIAAALCEVHKHGIIHRDIKPANVLLIDDQPILTDFGIALPRQLDEQTLTQSGAMIGTTSYMAPEFFKSSSSSELTFSADVYAFGVMLYEALSGQKPHTGDSEIQIIHSVLQKTPEPLISIRADIDSELAEFCERCLAKSIEQRPQSAEEILGTLKAIEKRLSQSNTTTTAIPTLVVSLIVSCVLVAVIAIQYLGQTAVQAKLDKVIQSAESLKQSSSAELDRLKIQRSQQACLKLIEGENYLLAKTKLTELEALLQTQSESEDRDKQIEFVKRLIRSCEFENAELSQWRGSDGSPLKLDVLSNRTKSGRFYTCKGQSITEYQPATRKSRQLNFKLPEQTQITELVALDQFLFVCAEQSDRIAVIYCVDIATGQGRPVFTGQPKLGPAQHLAVHGPSDSLFFCHNQTFYRLNFRSSQSNPGLRNWHLGKTVFEITQNQNLKSQLPDAQSVSIYAESDTKLKVCVALDNSLCLVFVIDCLQSTQTPEIKMNVRFTGNDLKHVWWSAQLREQNAIWVLNSGGALMRQVGRESQSVLLPPHSISVIVANDQISQFTAIATTDKRLIILDDQLAIRQVLHDIEPTQIILNIERREVIAVERGFVRRFRIRGDLTSRVGSKIVLGNRRQLFSATRPQFNNTGKFGQIHRFEFDTGLQLIKTIDLSTVRELRNLKYYLLQLDLDFRPDNDNSHLFAVVDSYGRDDPIPAHLIHYKFTGRDTQRTTAAFPDLKALATSTQSEGLLLIFNSDDRDQHTKFAGFLSSYDDLSIDKIRWLNFHKAPIIGHALSRRGSRIALQSSDGTISIWSVPLSKSPDLVLDFRSDQLGVATTKIDSLDWKSTGAPASQSRLPLAFSPGANQFSIITPAGVLRQFGLNAKTKVNNSTQRSCFLDCTELFYIADDLMLICCQTQLILWDVTHSCVVWRRHLPTPIVSAHINAELDRVAVVDQREVVRIVEIPNLNRD